MDNVFVLLESLQEHICAAEYALAHPNAPEAGKDGTSVQYHLSAIREYSEKAWEALIPLLPEQFAEWDE